MLLPLDFSELKESMNGDGTAEERKPSGDRSTVFSETFRLPVELRLASSAGEESPRAVACVKGEVSGLTAIDVEFGGIVGTTKTRVTVDVEPGTLGELGVRKS